MEIIDQRAVSSTAIAPASGGTSADDVALAKAIDAFIGALVQEGDTETLQELAKSFYQNTGGPGVPGGGGLAPGSPFDSRVSSPAAARLIQRVTQNLSQSFNKPPKELELQMARQGLSWAPFMPPGQPIAPVWGYRPGMRTWDYPIGINTQITPRAGRVSFATIKALWDAYDVAQICTNHLINDVRTLDFHFEAARGIREDVSEDVRKAYAFFEIPDKEQPFRAWLAEYLMDVIRYDAGSLYVRRNERGEPIALEVVSGSTIIPMVDYWGRPPTDVDETDPALTPDGMWEGEVTPAYIQIIEGMVAGWWPKEDIIYQRIHPQPDSQYGLAPLEAVLLTANTDLRFQWHFLQYFTEGAIPQGFMQAPPDMSSPAAVREWQKVWDAFMVGDQARKQQIRWVPHDSKYEPVGPAAEKQFNPEFPLYLMRRTCAAHGVTPADLGFTETVNKATSEVQVDVQFRVGTLPYVRHAEDVITMFCQQQLGLRVRARFDTGREIEDRLNTAQAEDYYIKNGTLSPDEPRARMGYPIDLNNPTPRFVYTPRTGPAPLAALNSIAGEVDPETYSVPRNFKPIPHPYFEAPGVAPVMGSMDYKNAQDSTAAMQANMVARAAGKPEPYTDDVMRPVSPSPNGLSYAKPAPKPQATKPKAKSKSKAAAKALEGIASNYRAGGIAVVAQDTGRVLMVQRDNRDETKKAAGKWEFPGGLVEPGENVFEAAKREWQEETGNKLPEKGRIVGKWDNEKGPYRLFVYAIKFESDVNLNPDRDDMEVVNPDHPNAKQTEVMAWWDPKLAASAGKALRKELRDFDWSLIDEAAKEDISKDAGAGGATAGVTAGTGMHGVDMREKRTSLVPAPASVRTDDDDEDEEDAEKAERIAIQLRQWKENARNRMRKGLPPKRFVSADLPAEVAEDIWTTLSVAKTREDIDKAFLPKVSAPSDRRGEQGLRDALANVVSKDAQREAIRTAIGRLWAVRKASTQSKSRRRRARAGALSVLLKAELAIAPVIQALLALWARAGKEGFEAAVKQLGKGNFPEVGEHANLRHRAEPVAQGMAYALVYELAEAIARGTVGELDEEEIEQLVDEAIDRRASIDEQAQARKAHMLALVDTYRDNGVERVAWVGGECNRCQANAAASPIEINHDWPDGPPPVHPDCQCGLAPA